MTRWRSRSRGRFRGGTGHVPRSGDVNCRCCDAAGSYRWLVVLSDNCGEAVKPEIRIAIVDDHELVIDGLRAWFREHAPEITVIFGGGRVDDALQVADRVDAVVLDIELGDSEPRFLHSLEQFVDRGIPVLIVSASVNAVEIRDGIASGARGYLAKSSTPRDLVAALQVVAAGGDYIGPDLASMMADERLGQIPDLSSQELRALRLYASGLKLDTVARRMSVGRSTAKEYIDRVRDKYAALGRDARTKLQLSVEATRDGLIETRHPRSDR